MADYDNFPIDVGVELLSLRVNNPSRLPWVPSLASTRSFLDSSTFKQAGAVLFVKLKVQRLLGQTLPQYLPARYHKIDCAALSDEHPEDAVANAVQFAVFNYIYGPGHWSLIETVVKRYFNSKVKKFIDVLLLPAIYYHDLSRQATLFRGEKLHTCQTSSEFVMEPWVLLQLPWHPVLFVQWLVAVESEVHVVKTEFWEFYYWPVPPRLQPLVKRLLQIIETLEWLLIKGYTLVSWLVRDYPVIKPSVVETILDCIVLPAMAPVQFVLSKKAVAVVRALKQQAWPAEGSVTRGEEECAHGTLDMTGHSHVFSLNFQETEGKSGSLFGPTGNSVEEEMLAIKEFQYHHLEYESQANILTHADKDPGENSAMFREACRKASRDVMHLVKEKVSASLKGGVCSQLLQATKATGVKFFACLYFGEFLNEDYAKGVRPKDLNVAFNMCALESKQKAAEHTASCLGYLYARHKERGRKVFLFAANANNPNYAMDPDVLEQALADVESGTWTRETLAAAFPQECKLDVDKNEECPDGALSPLETMKNFELRVKRLVYNMFRESISSVLTEEPLHFPAWQFIQYVLPCFVALIGCLSQNTNFKSTGELTTFTHFVHQLIQSFEMHPLPEKLPDGHQETSSEWMTEAAVETLKRQVSSVETDLGVLVHGTHKKSKKVGSVLRMLQSPLFGQMVDPPSNCLLLNKYNIKSEMPSYIRNTQHCISRIQAVVRQGRLAQCESQPFRNELQLLFVAEELRLLAGMCSKQPMDPTIDMLLSHADWRIKTVMKQQPDLPAEGQRPDKKRMAELLKLSVKQVLGIVLFGLVCRLNQSLQHTLDCILKPKPYLSALLLSVRELVGTKNWRGLKSFLTPLLVNEEGTNLLSVDWEFASKTAPCCYRSVLKEAKVLFVNPTSLELQHLMSIRFCRGCHTFEGTILMCSVCADNLDFPDIHWFCSQKCETSVLEAGHYAEHDHLMMVNCGLFSE